VTIVSDWDVDVSTVASDSSLAILAELTFSNLSKDGVSVAATDGGVDRSEQLLSLRERCIGLGLDKRNKTI
jgi:tellurite resistance protein